LYAATFLAPLLFLVGVSVAESKPNILVIVADDLGFTDIGVYGSEIRTPNLDRLAASGILLTDFHSSPACSPTRAMLLTGVDSHLAGLGTMAGEWDANQYGQPGYEGYLNFRVVTIARLLRDAGYQTCMAGKWHLGTTEETGPHHRGFAKSFALLEGGASHFSDGTGLVSAVPKATYRENGRNAVLPSGFYSSDFYTDKLIEYLEEDLESNRPFFAYLSFTAPHWPLQAPEEYIDRYKGVYDAGYEELRNRRMRKAEALGIVLPGTRPARRLPEVPAWESLDDTQKKFEARKMEIYAAMVENLDFNVGKILDCLERVGRLDNTFVFFFSDNGPEGNDINNLSDNRTWILKRFDNRHENMGRRNSYLFLGPGWAQAGAGHLSRFKSFPTEGGIRVPAIIYWKGMGIRPRRCGVFTSVLDIAPTLLALAGKGPPDSSYGGRTIHPIQGKSMLPFLKGESESIHGRNLEFGCELFGRRAFRSGAWKILWLGAPWGSGRWRLFNLDSDPGETEDLSGREPEILENLEKLWEKYQARNHVILPARDTGYANPKPGKP